MKYHILLRILRILMYIKRFLWWLGGHLSSLLKRVLVRLWHAKGYVSYRVRYRLKKVGLVTGKDWLYRRSVIQGGTLFFLMLIALPQTNLWQEHGFGPAGTSTKLYRLFADTNEIEDYEEITAAPSFGIMEDVSPWQEAALSNTMVGQPVDPENGSSAAGYDVLADSVAGLAIIKPLIMPGAILSNRTAPVEYQVEPGDSLYSIAADFGVSISTIMWENGLTVRSILRPGDKLSIPPVTGVMHLVKRGDTVGKIAQIYSATAAEIILFNRLDEQGQGLIAGERIVVPNGSKQNQAIAQAPRPSTVSTVRRAATPPPSRQAAGSSGFVWPSGARTVTQGYSIRHHALDIAGPFHTPNYAANAGKVVMASCPAPGQYRGPKLNSGYGCQVTIDHGNGIRTLYGHNDQVLVSVGDFVERGQTIGLMGNTGNVRGVTGIHLHFEVIVNNQRVNPYGYVR